MTELLLKWCIKTSRNADDPQYRSACGKLAGLVGIVCNAVLFVLKLVAGLLSGSVSVLADGINNLADASGSVVTLLGFKLAEKPADDDHPYGHARMEYLTGLVVAFMILLIGAELVKTSVQKIFSPEETAFSWLTAGILVASVGIKLWLAGFCKKLAGLIGSSALEATAADSRNDVLSTLAVLTAGLLSMFFGWKIDGYVGLAVAAFILYSGVGIVKDTIDPLLGTTPDPALVEQVSRTILAQEKVLGIHDLIVHDYGPGRRFASVHVEMDSREDPLVCHDIIDDLERECQKRHNLHLVIHYDPLITDDQELTRMRQLVEEEIRAIDERLSIHDFRMVAGPGHTNLIFDLVIPFDMETRREELRSAIDRRVQFAGKQYYTVITFDHVAFQ